MKKLSYVIVCFFLFTAAICSCSKDDNPEEEITPSSLPTITNLVQSIASPQPGDQVIISATVTTEKGTTLSAVTLKWTLDGANQTSVAMSNGGTGDVYSGTITGQIAAGVAVAYTVSATNVNGTTDKSGNYTVKALPTPTGYSQLFLN